MKVLKKIFWVLLIVLLLIQFYPKPTKNSSEIISTNDITAIHNVPADVQQVLKTSCYDCHSNNTAYPWYSRMQPVAMWLGNHINEGKRELNFSEFGSYPIGKQYRKLDALNEEVKEGEMPLTSYTLIHWDAKLDDAKKLLVANWANALRDSMKANYPADSLARKKKA